MENIKPNYSRSTLVTIDCFYGTNLKYLRRRLIHGHNRWERFAARVGMDEAQLKNVFNHHFCPPYFEIEFMRLVVTSKLDIRKWIKEFEAEALDPMTSQSALRLPLGDANGHPSTLRQAPFDKAQDRLRQAQEAPQDAASSGHGGEAGWGD